MKVSVALMAMAAATTAAVTNAQVALPTSNVNAPLNPDSSLEQPNANGGAVGLLPTPGAARSNVNKKEFHMKPVRTIQARVQSDAPLWDPTNQAFYSSFGKDFESGYRSALDTVNTGSVEGALMYVQAEGIDVDKQSEKCVRKNNMSYVVFYDILFAQTNETLAQFQENGDTNEFGPMVAMDGGACTAEGSKISDNCLMMNGEKGLPNIGPFVGGTSKETDDRAPYPNNYWFSYPNTCPTKKWKDKTDECRKSTRGGLCPFGQIPDGVTCTYSYHILGYIAIDDLVGITKEAKNFKDFCENGGIEFSSGKKKMIEFWENPTDQEANVARSQKLVESYNGLVTNTWEGNTLVDPQIVANMKPLPELEELMQQNPKCYENALKCSKAPCKRSLYAQLCLECQSGDEGCEEIPSGFKFPKLAKAEGEKKPEEEPVDEDGDGKISEEEKDNAKKRSANNDDSAAMSASTVSIVTGGLTLVSSIVLFFQ